MTKVIPTGAKRSVGISAPQPPESTPTTHALPPGWRWARLGDVTSRAATTDPHRHGDGTFNYIDISSIDAVHKTITGAATLANAEAPSRARQIVQAGDVLVSGTRPNLNAVAMVPPELDGAICSTGFCVLRPTGEIAGGWLFSFVRSKSFIDVVSDMVVGALYPAVTDRQVRLISLPLPPLPEQRRIAGVLREALDAVRRAREAALARLEAARALPAAFLRSVFESEEAQSWPWVRLGDVCDVQLGKMLSPKSKTGTAAQPYLRNANVLWDRFDLADISEMDFSGRELEKFELRPGDLLVCEGGEPGRSAVWNGQISPCFYQKALHRLRPVRDIDPRFVMYRLWMGALQEEFVETHAKTTIAHLPAVRLRTLRIQQPPVTVQKAAVARLDEHLARAGSTAKTIEAELALMDNLPQSLLRRAFAGEL